MSIIFSLDGPEIWGKNRLLSDLLLCNVLHGSINGFKDRFDTPDFDMYVNAEKALIQCIRGDEFEGELNAITTL